ncbi:MAG: ABC transporter ATP-binding protein [Anaerolineales bacterium]|nr:ABC transporter ATP-binding protein [Anaerolineales bacterium]
MTENNIVLEARGITKQFPGVLANDQVDFDLRNGEIHALLGENGAGKTTLMNILYGLYHQDAGEVFLNGQPIEIHSSRDSIKAGIGMVHQHFMLVPVFSVAENIMLGDEITRLGMILDEKAVAKRVLELSRQYGLDVDPQALVGQLPVGVQQRVEIIKTLYRDASILILDEPTAVLTPQEAEDLFRIMHELTERGVSIIFITHKLKEVLAIADRITVMRAGKVIGTVTPKETSEQKLATMMVGRDVILTVDKGLSQPGEEVLKVDRLKVHDFRGLEVVREVSFEVRAGEVLGIAGVQGNGQTELVEALTGLRPTASGRMLFAGKDLTGKPPRPLTETGMAHVPEDRQRHGLVLNFSVADNMVLNTYYRPPFARFGVMQPEAIDANARNLVKEFDVRTPSPFVAVSKLSGGNQQKVIVARELSHGVKLLLANQPTRGLDVGSIEYIHQEIVAMRDRGVGVLLVSAELDEIMALSDRIAVMYHGQIVTTVDAKKVTREQLGLWMAGARPEE